MKLFGFDMDGREIDRFGSLAMTHFRIGESSGEAGVSCIRLGQGGVVGRHPAGGPQLFLVVEGEGTVSGGDGEPQPIRSGQGAYWEAGEEHETRTGPGLVAIVVEGELLALSGG